jgi:hypothetical protein
MLPISIRESKIDRPLNIQTIVVTAKNSGAAFSNFPGWPLEECNMKWLELQKELLNVSTKSRQVIFEKADHNLQVSAAGELIKLIKSLLQ